jgi:3-phenylpropionate/trans-cinnamate dioxygenase ferredoxin subunit
LDWKSEMKANNKRTPPFVRVGRVEDFPINKGKRVSVDGTDVAVFNVGGRFYALKDQCTHAAAPLSSGTVKGSSVRCPRHGAHFDLSTGVVLTLQAVRNVETFEVRVEKGDVFVCTEGRTADPLWVHGRRLDQGAPALQECMTGMKK